MQFRSLKVLVILLGFCVEREHRFALEDTAFAGGCPRKVR